jgi:hypothetical protein
VTKSELLEERERLGDMLALALGHLDAVLERLNDDPKPTKRKAKPKRAKPSPPPPGLPSGR